MRLQGSIGSILFLNSQSSGFADLLSHFHPRISDEEIHVVLEISYLRILCFRNRIQATVTAIRTSPSSLNFASSNSDFAVEVPRPICHTPQLFTKILYYFKFSRRQPRVLSPFSLPGKPLTSLVKSLPSSFSVWFLVCLEPLRFALLVLLDFASVHSISGLYCVSSPFPCVLAVAFFWNERDDPKTWRFGVVGAPGPGRVGISIQPSSLTRFKEIGPVQPVDLSPIFFVKLKKNRSLGFFGSVFNSVGFGLLKPSKTFLS